MESKLISINHNCNPIKFKVHKADLWGEGDRRKGVFDKIIKKRTF